MNTMIGHDEELAALVQHGDADAFGQLVGLYEAKLKRYARKFLRFEDDIEDLVQDVFIKAYTNIQSFDVRRRFSPWIYRIAHNTFVNELKRKGARGDTLFDFDTVLPFLASPDTADAMTLSDELRTRLDALLDGLSPKYREVIILYYIEELSYEEMSDVLKIPVTTVGVRLKRGRDKLLAAYREEQV